MYEKISESKDRERKINILKALILKDIDKTFKEMNHWLNQGLVDGFIIEDEFRNIIEGEHTLFTLRDYVLLPNSFNSYTYKNEKDDIIIYTIPLYRIETMIHQYNADFVACFLGIVANGNGFYNLSQYLCDEFFSYNFIDPITQGIHLKEEHEGKIDKHKFDYFYNEELPEITVCPIYGELKPDKDCEEK